MYNFQRILFLRTHTIFLRLCKYLASIFWFSKELGFPCMNSCADSLTNVLMTMHTFVATRCIMPNFATTCNVIEEEKEGMRGKDPWNAACQMFFLFSQSLKGQYLIVMIQIFRAKARNYKPTSYIIVIKRFIEHNLGLKCTI